MLATLQLSLLSLTAQESPAPGVSTSQQQPSRPSGVSAQAAPPRDGAHDFDFLVGNWKAHVRRLPDRLIGSTTWIEYDGISNHKKILDSNANFEEFEVDNPEKHLHIKGKRSGYTIRTRISGVSTLWTWTRALSTCRRLLVNLPTIAASSTIRNNIRAARSWCATSG